MNQPTHNPSSSRTAFLRRYWPWFAAPAAILPVVLVLSPGGGDAGSALPTAVVERGPLTISVIESGTIRPHQQVILRNEMDADSTILFIVDEGSFVRKGDLLVELDATMFETERLERRIRVQNGEAALIYAQENYNVVTNQAQADIEQAELDLQFAKLDLQKYLEGEYPKQLKELEAQIALAEAELRRAEEDLRWSQVLFSEKYLSQSDLQQDELVAKRADLDLDLAREALTLATNYTHLRQVTELRSNVKQAAMALERTRRKALATIAQAEAEVRASEAEYEEDKERLRRVEAEIAKARIVAPIDGMVLYASSVSNDWDDDDPRIHVGAAINERREIIYLPTAHALDVDIRIPEVNLSKVQPGLPARVVVDALPGTPLAGRVTTISPLPDSRSRFLNPNLKLYNAVIGLNPTSASIRNGMSCRVEIIAATFRDTLYVPMQAVVRIGAQPTVYRVADDGLQPVPVEVGLDNNRVVQVLSGLEEGQVIALNPPLSTPGAQPLFDIEDQPGTDPSDPTTEPPDPSDSSHPPDADETSEPPRDSTEENSDLTAAPAEPRALSAASPGRAAHGSDRLAPQGIAATP